MPLFWPTLYFQCLNQARSTVTLSGYRVVLYTSIHEHAYKWKFMKLFEFRHAFDVHVNPTFLEWIFYIFPFISRLFFVTLIFFTKTSSRRITVTEFDYAAKCRQIAEATEGLSGREISKIAVAWQTSAFASSDGVLTEEMIDEKVMLAVEDHKKKEDWNRYRLPGDVAEVYRSEKDAAAATLKSSVWGWRLGFLRIPDKSICLLTSAWLFHLQVTKHTKSSWISLPIKEDRQENSVIGYSNISLFQILGFDCMSTAQDLNFLELNTALFRKQSVYPENTESCYNRAFDGAPLFLSRKQSWTV